MLGTIGSLVADSSETTGLKWQAPASTTPTFIGASVYNSQSQTLSNTTFTALTFDSENFDTDAFHSTSSNTSRFTIPSGKGGYYLLTFMSNWDTNATGNRVVRFYKNGSAIYQHYPEHTNLSGSYPGFSYSLVTSAAATDYFEVFLWHSAGGNLAHRSNYSNFQISFLGA